MPWRSAPVTCWAPTGWPRRCGASEPPRSWSKVVQGCVLRLRRALGPSSIETTTAGYRLALADDEIDSRRFEELVDRGVSLAATGEFDRAIVVFSRALDLWRGPPFDVLDSWLPGRIEAARLDELRRSTEERLLDARLASGEHRDVVAIAEVRVAEEPLREHRWATLALAQYRCGRQADALRSLRRARQTLVEELGIEPGTEIVALERAILDQDDDLARDAGTPGDRRALPVQGAGTLRRRRRRGLLRADRRRVPSASSDCGPTRCWSSPVRRAAASRRSPGPVWCRHWRAPASRSPCSCQGTMRRRR